MDLKTKIKRNKLLKSELKMALLSKFDELSDEQKSRLEKAMNNPYEDALFKVQSVEKKIIKSIREDAEKYERGI
jgi:hypothetical protein